MLSRRTLLAGAALLPVAAHAQPITRQDARQDARQDDSVAPGYRREVLVRWGDRVGYDAPPFDPQALTLDAAATQFGWDALVLGLMQGPPAEDGVARALLAVAHPTAEARMMFPGGVDRPSVAAAAQGASILNLEQRGGRWVITDGGYQSRRLTANTLCAVTGSATSVAGQSVQGVLAVAGGCPTPWGTLLLGEGDPDPWLARLRDGRNPASFGWMVELDPFDPQSVPAKRTALGRFGRGGAAATLAADGRAVVFMSDDREGGHLFRFISSDPAGAGNPGLLDSGTLYVGVAEGWSLRWVKLPDDPTARLAALDAARQNRAETFDRPAGLAVGPDGALFVTCRGTGHRAQPDSLNPRPNNPDGHALMFLPDGRDPGAERFSGEIILLGGEVLSRPASVMTEPAGGLWIGTEKTGLAYAAPGSFAIDVVYTPPLGAAMGGSALSPDNTTLFAGVRHPGATPGASFDRPATRWPTLRPDMPPQSIIAGLVLPR
jgi:secreted PhoX family phosphatase